VTLPHAEAPGDPAVELLDRATARHREGDLAGARALYREALSLAPGLPLALFRSGLLELQAGDAPAAAQLVDAAMAAAPDEPRYRLGAGTIATARGQWREAALAYAAAVRLAPGDAEAWTLLGNSRRQEGEPALAAEAWRAALALQPDLPEVLANLGSLLLETGQAAAALPLLLRAQALQPRIADIAYNAGVALRRLGRVQDAAQQYRQALVLRPDHLYALINLGNACRDDGDYAAAAASYEQALQLRPGSIEALNNAGCLARTLGQLDLAEARLRAALRLDPGNATLHDNLGNVLKDAGELDAALAAWREALRLDPQRAATHSNLCYALSFHSGDPQAILAECRRWNERFAAGLWDPAQRHANTRLPGRRLRIGYVSADFRDHCQALFLVPLLSAHDPDAVEVFCYSSVLRPDAVTARLRALAAVWRDVQLQDDAALAAQVRADGIDILVDLTMHMAGGRPLLFARKPAPVQVAWLAYPGTTGIAAIDYRLSDPRLDPPGSDADYSERTLRLAGSFWCYDPLAAGPPPGDLPALRGAPLTFGCLNNPCKLTPATLALWSPLLHSLPASRLVLLAPPGRHRERLAARLADVGIAPARVQFVAFRPRAQYLASYQDIDIGLDTLPYNGHTTSLDALWMGVPVVTCSGTTCAGRATASQLALLGLEELAPSSAPGFVAAATALAADLPRLAQLRAGLRARLQASPLMDGPRFARQLEAAYRAAWNGYCAGGAAVSA
jgi:predicted O-linked N-acetylglucosamine transferase (SPINDLY family)